MKIVALNLDIQWKSPLENFKIIERQLENQTADLFVLPEMFSTGFCMDFEEIDHSGKVLEWMKALAQRKNTAVAGSVSVKENEKFYNRFYFVLPNGEFHQYDKKHLFSYGGEDKVYTAGNERVIVDFLGFRILLLICYDLRFPVFSRNRGDYDGIICVANWPKSRIEAWQTLLKARAIENQSFVFGVNRIGIDGNQLHYPESSFCFFADGSEISEKENAFVSAKWDLKNLNEYREKYPFLKDGDNFEIFENSIKI